MKKTANIKGIVRVALLINLSALAFILWAILISEGGMAVTSTNIMALCLTSMPPLISLYVIFKCSAYIKNEKSLFGLWIAVKKKKLKEALND
jgi:hypothetical protein